MKRTNHVSQMLEHALELEARLRRLCEHQTRRLEEGNFSPKEMAEHAKSLKMLNQLLANQTSLCARLAGQEIKVEAALRKLYGTIEQSAPETPAPAAYSPTAEEQENAEAWEQIKALLPPDIDPMSPQAFQILVDKFLESLPGSDHQSPVLEAITQDFRLRLGNLMGFPV